VEQLKEGCWAIVGWGDGLNVYSVWADELGALRSCNGDAYMGNKVIFLPWGMDPTQAEKDKVCPSD
jgi:hypothetical protein